MTMVRSQAIPSLHFQMHPNLILRSLTESTTLISEMAADDHKVRAAAQVNEGLRRWSQIVNRPPKRYSARSFSKSRSRLGVFNLVAAWAGRDIPKVVIGNNAGASGCPRQIYRDIKGGAGLSVKDGERGVQCGRVQVWRNLQILFCQPDEGGIDTPQFCASLGISLDDQEMNCGIWTALTGLAQNDRLMGKDGHRGDDQSGWVSAGEGGGNN